MFFLCKSDHEIAKMLTSAKEQFSIVKVSKNFLIRYVANCNYSERKSPRRHDKSLLNKIHGQNIKSYRIKFLLRRPRLKCYMTQNMCPV